MKSTIMSGEPCLCFTFFLSALYTDTPCHLHLHFHHIHATPLPLNSLSSGTDYLETHR